MTAATLPASSSRTGAGVAMLAAVVALLAGASGCGSAEPPPGSTPETTAAVDSSPGLDLTASDTIVPPTPPAPAAGAHPSLDPSVKYLGIDACRSCHQDIYDSFRKTGMGRSWHLMTPDKVNADYQENNEIQIPDTGLFYRMEKRDGRYYQRQFVRDSRGEEYAVDERELTQISGSGNHSETYIVESDGRLYQAPVAWYNQAGIWDLAPGYEYKNQFFARGITKECTFCHNAVMKPLPGTKNEYARTPEGIDCERCHGPGELHVERWSGLEPVLKDKDEEDWTIINPRRLPLELRKQVCFQCHLGGSETGERIERVGTDIWDFRPGRPLMSSLVAFWYEQPLHKNFNVTGQVDRLLRSKCYSASGGRLECLTCHNPHISIYSEDRPDDYFRNKCLGCHAEDDCDGEAAARQATAPPDDCVTCHMRRGEPSDHKHVRFIDHWIRRTVDIDESETRTEFRFVPIMDDVEQRLTPAEVEYYRGRTGIFKAAQTPPGPQRDELRAGAEEALTLALEKGFRTADAWHFYGKNLTYVHRYADAVAAFRQALAIDPDHREASYELGAALFAMSQQGSGPEQAAQLEEAAGIFTRMSELDPTDPAPLAELGRCQLARRDPVAALELFEKAVALDPYQASLHANRGMALAILGRGEAALEAMERAAALDPENVPIWSFWAQLLQQAGRLERARDVAARAGMLARRVPTRGAPAMSGGM